MCVFPKLLCHGPTGERFRAIMARLCVEIKPNELNELAFRAEHKQKRYVSHTIRTSPSTLLQSEPASPYKGWEFCEPRTVWQQTVWADVWPCYSKQRRRKQLIIDIFLVYRMSNVAVKLGRCSLSIWQVEEINKKTYLSDEE